MIVCGSSVNLLAHNIMYHSWQGVSRFVLAVHNPTEELSKTINLLQRNYDVLCIKVREKVMSQDLQVTLVNTMVDILSESCDWALNLDDDEFYCGLDFRYLSKVSDDVNKIYTGGYCFYESDHDYPCAYPALSMICRDPESKEYDFKKPIFRPKGFCTTTPGNHYIQLVPNLPSITLDFIKIHHYTYRSKISFVNSQPITQRINAQQFKDKGLVIDTRLRDRLIKLMSGEYET
jgi:hypothetical protein